MKAHICSNTDRFNIEHMSNKEVVNMLEYETANSFFDDKEEIFRRMRKAILCIHKLSNYGDCTWLAHVKHQYTQNDMIVDYVVIVDYNPDTDNFYVIMDNTDKFGINSKSGKRYIINPGRKKFT